MLKNYWYPLLPSSELEKGCVRGTRLFDTPIALFRDASGEVYGLEDACMHRSAPLSAGEVIGSALRCPYHGWSYQGDGQCSHIPTLEPGQAVDDNIRVRAFPVMEACELIWLWPGDPAAATDWPEMAELEQEYHQSPNWQVTNYARELDFRHSLLIENLLDPAHIHFVHAGTMSQPENAGPIHPQLTITEEGFSNRKKGGFGVFSSFQGPALVALYFNFGPGSKQTQLFYCLPLSDTRMQLLSRIYTPVKSQHSSAKLIAGVDYVLDEDIKVLSLLELRLREGYPQTGRVVEADRAIVEYHRWCKKAAS